MDGSAAVRETALVPVWTFVCRIPSTEVLILETYCSVLCFPSPLLHSHRQLQRKMAHVFEAQVYKVRGGAPLGGTELLQT